jgi:hypothetical protein
MEPDICPPWWPNLLWWLLHHPHGPGPDPGPIDKGLLTRLDAHFAAVAVAALATRLSDRTAREEVGRIAGELASDPMPGLAVRVG